MNYCVDEIFRFRNLPVYRDARIFRKELKVFIKRTFPKEEKFILTQQIVRALDSILLNIAEGLDRYSGKSTSNFLNYAIGSLDEVVAGLDAALDDGYINEADLSKFQLQAVPLMKQLKALCAAIRNSNRKN